MKRLNVVIVVALAVCLAVLAGPFAVAAKKGKKSKGGIPAHPTKLEYGALEFGVPDASKYRHELSNGIPVFIAEDRALPLVNVNITVRAGNFIDAKPGVADWTGRMLRQGGTASKSAEKFDEEVGFLAAEISSSAGDLSSSAGFNCITPVLDETLDLFFEMLKTPGFEQARLDVEKGNALERMKQRNDNPASISRREWSWLIRGRESFLSAVLTKAQLDGISREALADFHKKYWRPENMIITVSGDVKSEEILRKLNARFEGWNPDGPDVAWPPPGPRHTPTPGVYRVEKDIPQGRVSIGHLGLHRTNWDDPDAFALQVMNGILGGGGFTSRLMRRIRSDEGLAYSAGSSYGISQYWPGIFAVRYQSKSPTVALAAKITLAEINSLRDSPVSQDEMDDVKNSMIEVFPRRFESAGNIVGVFAQDEYNGRPASYWQTYQERIRAVTVEDVQRVAKEHLKPESLVFLIIGKWEEIEPGDADGRASMAEFGGGKSQEIPLRDPLTLEPM